MSVMVSGLFYFALSLDFTLTLDFTLLWTPS